MKFSFKNLAYLLNKRPFKIVSTSACLLGIAGVGFFSEIYPTKAFCEAKAKPSIDDRDLYDYNKCKQFIKQYKVNQLLKSNMVIELNSFQSNSTLFYQQEEFGIPGLVVAVSRNNQVVYSRGFGFSDVENSLKANQDTVMRIASISKPIALAVAAKLIELNKLDIDKPVNEYVKDLPPFKFNNKEFKITTRQLMCHTSGIRHYREEMKKEKKENGQGDTSYDEFYLNKNFKTTKDALSLFINDELVNEPG
jgi:serine beta-lactamase-like protein LACTB